MPDAPHLPEEPRTAKLTRRSLLALGVVAGATALSRYWRPALSHLAGAGSTPAPPLNFAEAQDYRDFLAIHPLRYLSPSEILRPHHKCRSGIPCGIPPREYWSNLLPTLEAADELRARLGVPLLEVTSAYRSPAYNAKCPGAVPGSQHTYNRALDLVYDCPPEEAFAAALALRAEGFFTGGLGLYEGFIHLDTRGTDATWGV